MKKLLLLAGLVMAAVLIACGNAGASTPSATSDDGSTTTITIDGQSVKVDTFTANHYADFEIQEALKREAFVSKKAKPVSASSFGKKRAEVVWRAIRPDRAEEGRVTVIHYEKGLEIKKDGVSWFYDGILYKKVNPRHITGTEPILHHGVWEPAWTDFLLNGLLSFRYLYTAGCPNDEAFSMIKTDLKKLNISDLNDLIISAEEF